MHSPKYTDAERKAWRARGSLARAKSRLPVNFTKADFSTGDSARAVLEETTDLVRAGKIPVSVANAVSKLIGTGARLGELALAAKLTEIEARLKASEPTRKARR